MTIESAQSIVREFNRLHPVGSPCWVIRADGSAFQGSTNGEAFLIGEKEACDVAIWVKHPMESQPEPSALSHVVLMRKENEVNG